MNRLTAGVVLGGLAVYLLDPELGEERRERLFSLWRENRGSAVQAGRAVSQAAESARPLARRMSKAVGRGDWAEAFDRGRSSFSLPKLIGAAVIGGTLVYFLDPVKGSERRQWLLLAWQEKRHSMLEVSRQAARQATKAVKPHVGGASDQVAHAAEGVASKVR
jgi:gas vesicle protein